MYKPAEPRCTKRSITRVLTPQLTYEMKTCSPGGYLWPQNGVDRALLAAPRGPEWRNE